MIYQHYFDHCLRYGFLVQEKFRELKCSACAMCVCMKRLANSVHWNWHLLIERSAFELLRVRLHQLAAMQSNYIYSCAGFLEISRALTEEDVSCQIFFVMMHRFTEMA